MEAKLQNNSLVRFAVSHVSLRKGIGWGMTGGLAATVVMDLVLMAIFLAVGEPPFSCFSIVGDTVARLFSFQDLASSVPLGAAAHYVIGPLLGALFGAAARYAPVLRAGSRKKVVLLAILYAEIASQPILALAPVLLRMTTSDTLQWFGGSFGMHLIWGAVLGAVWSLEMQLRLAGEGMADYDVLR